MWAIRFLNGKLAGQELPLQDGKYILGRAEECQIVIPEAGVSKKHAELEVDEHGVSIVDLQSSNGIFINGVQIQESEIQPKDKVSLYRVTFDIVRASKSAMVSLNQQQMMGQNYAQQAPVAGMPPAMYPGSGNDGQSAIPGDQAGAMPADGNIEGKSAGASTGPLTLKNWFSNYINTVVLPGIYKLPEWLELKWVIACFLIVFVLIVTSLSSVPLIQILNSSVEQASMDHAESIATTLAQMNKEAVKDKMYTATNVDYAFRRPGVKKAFIILAKDGRIVAPADRVHTYSKLSFINKGRKQEKTTVEKIDSQTVGAMVPIIFYNSKTNMHTAYAYSAVVYDIGSLAFNNKRTLSLLVQTFFIAFVLGVLLFFFLYKMIEYPIVVINRQLNLALRDDTIDVRTSYDFPALQNLVSNINSALSRLSSVSQEEQSALSNYDRMTEMNQMVEMIGYPTLGINMEARRVEAVSAHFEDDTGVSEERILNCSVEDIDDQALKLNIIGLLEKIQQHPSEIASDSLEFSGVEFHLIAKGIYGKDGVAYTLICFTQDNPEE